jgi:hypothetical protein
VSRFPTLAGLVVACAATAAPTQIQAQAPAGQAIAVGAVYDSVRLRPLAGARIRLDSSDVVTMTDADGRFRMEGIAPGPHQLRVEHPFVDTLGVSLRSPTANFAASETRVVELAIPSQESLVNVLCAAAWRARGPALLTGRIREADTGAPAIGAKVSLVWYEIATMGGVRRTPRVRESPVGPDGIYRICGLPAELEGKAQVIRGGVTSGDVPIAFGQDIVALRSMSVARAGTIVTEETTPQPDSTGKPAEAPPPPRVYGAAKLSGRVVNKANQPIEAARVQVDGSNRAALTRANGEFTLDSLPAGTQTVSARKLGFALTEIAVDLSSLQASTVTIAMDDFVPVLETVRVSAQRTRALDDVGFNMRKRMGSGFFMEGDEVTNRTMSRFSDVLRTAPGIQIQRRGDRQFITSTRDPVNGCVKIFIDGAQWQQIEPGDVDDFLRPGEVGAIEVYSPTTTPAEFEGAARGSCTTVVVWTSRRLDRRK